MTQFIREFRLEVGEENSIGRLFEDLHIEFDITKTDLPEPNKATITIWNLSQDSANFVAKPGQLVQLFGGYENDVDLLFLGDNTRVVTQTDGVDTPTIIESGDGQAAYSNTNVNLKIKGETSVFEAVKKTITSAIKDPKKAAKAVKSAIGLGEATKDLPRGFAASGPLPVVLRGLARVRNFDWLWINGELFIVDPNEALRMPAVVVSPGTGLEGSPAKLTGKGKKGIQFKCRVNGKIFPRRIVQLQSEKFDGWYLVRKVHIKGSNMFGTECSMVVEATEIRP